MVALVFALEVPGVVGFEVAVADEGAEFEDGFGAGQGPAGSGDVEAVFDQVAAGAFDDAGGDRPAALTAGWPITTGVIEGACRHLIKDRMDITGARWSLPGAEAILKLRTVISNSDFDAYWAYHLTREHQRNHPQPRTTYQLAA